MTLWMTVVGCLWPLPHLETLESAESSLLYRKCNANSGDSTDAFQGAGKFISHTPLSMSDALNTTQRRL